MSKLLQSAKGEIGLWFQGQTPHVFSYKQIAEALRANRDDWRLSDDISTNRLIEFLLSETDLRLVELASLNHANAIAEKRYVWGKVSPFQLALSIKTGAYLCHATAVFLHGLSDQIPRRIYVNKEQSAKSSSGVLTQDAIHRAFKGRQRESTFIFEVGDSQAVLLWGKNTGRLEVTSLPYEGAALDVTSIERTLIDIAVRPAYAGGALQVLEAYRNALGKASVGTLIATLKRMDYIYPYHQLIGFYMQKAGFPKSQYSRLKEFGLDFDFYLVYGLKESDYNSEWRVFVPKGMQ
jgi:hypothetical protein